MPAGFDGHQVTRIQSEETFEIHLWPGRAIDPQACSPLMSQSKPRRLDLQEAEALVKATVAASNVQAKRWPTLPKAATAVKASMAASK